MRCNVARVYFVGHSLGVSNQSRLTTLISVLPKIMQVQVMRVESLMLDMELSSGTSLNGWFGRHNDETVKAVIRRKANEE